jgi:hypothetical protein
LEPAWGNVGEPCIGSRRRHGKFVVSDWDNDPHNPRDEISMRRKADDYKTLFAPEFGVKDGSLALPKGIIAGIAIEGSSGRSSREPRD